MIGHVQKNKAARAARIFDSIDSVDSLALAEKLDAAVADIAAESAVQKTTNSESKLFVSENRRRALLEVKLDPEPAKSGIAGEEVTILAEAILRLPHLELRGLMGVPPYFDNPEEARPYFRHLRELRDAARASWEMKSCPCFPWACRTILKLPLKKARPRCGLEPLFSAKEKGRNLA